MFPYELTFGAVTTGARDAEAHQWAAVCLAAVVLAFLLAPIILAFVYAAGRARRRDRLIALAMEHNQPDLARDMIARKARIWRVMLWVVLAIAALSMLDTSPSVSVLIAALFIVYLFIGARRRGSILARAAAATGDLETWLSKKARENAAAGGASDNKPTKPEST